MSTLKQLLSQLLNAKRLKHCLYFAIIPGTLGYALLLIVLSASGFTFLEAIRDSVQQTDTSSWLGLISNVGVLWTVSAAVICFFAISLKPLASGKQQRELLFLVGLLSALLAVDDFFLLHDRHIDERFMYITYAFCLVMILYRHFQRIAQIDGPAFLLAGGLLALSIFVDVIQGPLSFMYDQLQVLEEGCKFVGMATWLYFSYRAASLYITTRVTRLS